METEPGSPGDRDDKFVKLFFNELDIVFAQLRFKNIQPRDCVVLLAHVSLTDHRTGRCRATAERISELLDVQPSNVYISVKRLREAQLMVRSVDKRTGEKIYLINPYLFSGGTPKQRGLQLKTYMEAIQSEQHS